MKGIVGADIGGTVVKLVTADEKGNILSYSCYDNDRDRDRLMDEIDGECRNNGIDERIICTTGIGSGIFSANDAVTGFTEFECFGAGAQFMTGIDECAVVCIGTGTSFVDANGSSYRYFGGSGVGGGTFTGLCSRLIGDGDFESFVRIAEKGDPHNIDLTVGDICIGDSNEGVALDLTASNFGKPSADETAPDRASAAANLVLESIGVMSAFFCKSVGRNTAVFVGGLSDIPAAKKVLPMVGGLHGLDFVIAERGKYAAAAGAVRRYISCG